MEALALPLFIISLGAFAIPIFCRLINLPVIIGEILYGMCIRFIFPDILFLDIEFINVLASMGFIFLMFLAGLEIDFTFLKIRSLIGPTFFVLIMCVTGGLIVFMFFPSTFFYFTLLTATSVGVCMITLKSNRLELTNYGQKIIWTATLSELVTIFFIILYEVLIKHETVWELTFFTELSKFFILIFVAYLIIKIVLAFLWRYPNLTVGLENEEDISELSVRLSFFIMLMMVALSSYLHLELIMGSFLGGIMLSFIFRNKHAFESKLLSIGYGFFIPFFFIKVGIDFNVEKDLLYLVLKQGIFLYIAFLSIRFITLLFAYFTFWNFQKFKFTKTLKYTLASTMILSTPLTLLVALGKIGIDTNSITKIEYNAIIICAILSGGVGPFLFNVIFSKEKKVVE